MVWRKYATPVAVAELKLLIILSKRKLCRYLHTQQGFTFDREEDGVAGTFVDFYFGPYFYAVFLDGEQIHTKNRQQIKDELITKALERKGITVDRFMYKPPISNVRLHAIADKIEETLKTLKPKPRIPKKGVMAIFILNPNRLGWFLTRKTNLQCVTCKKWFFPGDIIVSKAKTRGYRQLRCLDCAITKGVLSTNIIAVDDSQP